jgi:acetoacetyl-CoA synthetase
MNNTTPRILWQPTEATKQNANLTHYFNWLQQNPKYNFDFKSYDEAWQWSVDNIEAFWVSIIEYFDVKTTQNSKPKTQNPKILSATKSRLPSGLRSPMPHTQWFEGITLNYAEHVFRKANDVHPAILFQSETQPLTEISWQILRGQVASFAHFLKEIGVEKGDRVVGFLPNIPEATVALLATISIGAVWSSASPDFGASSVLERFGQIEPKILIAVNGYNYGGKAFDKSETVETLQNNIPSLLKTVIIPYFKGGKTDFNNSFLWSQTIDSQSVALEFTPVEFSHPMWILYSSGTTGIPKAITHSQGGMLLEHLKYVHFHADVKDGERFFWFTTTGWMMWNFLNAALLGGATIVLYDGSPAYPNMNVLWQLVAATKINHFGTSAAYILACMKAEVKPSDFDLKELRGIGSTGSPLPPEGFDWIYTHVKPDVWLTSMSGGTDVCTAFVGGNPLLPVYEGEIQCRTMGCSMYAFDENGKPLMDEVGEMVITKPMPCMPIYFWNDTGFSKYKSSYFEEYEGIWRHGDWLKITERNTLVILGRSDATLNRQGIRIGTSEIYRSVESISEVKDSLIINIEKEDGDSYMPLFVVLKQGFELTNDLKKRINQTLRQDYSPRHVPDVIIEVPDIPYTISGKKLELPVKKILMGKAVETAVNLGSVRNPLALEFFKDLVL